MFRLFKRDPVNALSKMVDVLSKRYATLDSNTQQTFWITHGYARMQALTALCGAALQSRDDMHITPRPGDDDGLNRLAREAECIATEFAEREGEQSDRFTLDDPTVLRALFLSNLIEYVAKHGIDDYATMWSVYERAIAQRGLTPLISEIPAG